MIALFGRELRMLLELFKYITESPEPSELLLEKLKEVKSPKLQIVGNIIF